MLELVSDRGVIVSVIVAIAVVAVVAVLTKTAGATSRRRRPPAAVVWVPALLVAFAVAEIGIDPLGPPRSFSWWTIPLLVLGIVAATGPAFLRPGAPGGSRLDVGASLVTAAAAAGVFAAIPETNALRLIPGPVGIAALGAFAGIVRPLTAIERLAIVGGLGWLSFIDGQARPASTVGAAGCIAVIGLLYLSRSSGLSDGGRYEGAGDWSRADLRNVAVAIAAALACSRLAGVRESVPIAVLITIATLTIAAFAIAVSSSTEPDLGKQTATR